MLKDVSCLIVRYHNQKVDEAERKGLRQSCQLTRKPHIGNAINSIAFIHYTCFLQFCKWKGWGMTKKGYYTDGVTKYTDPFYQCVCRGCLHRFWSVIPTANCPKCGYTDMFRSFDYKEANEEAARLKNK